MTRKGGFASLSRRIGTLVDVAVAVALGSPAEMASN